MPLNIPFIFRAGTKAKANEVNANFQEVVKFNNQLETNSAANETEIALLKEDKADKNGNPTEIFQSATAVNGKDVINKDTLRSLTKNTIDVVRGMRLSASTNKIILCTSGDCWDSTYTKMISSTANMTVNITGVGANTTQYIYVCDGAAGSGKLPQLVISTNPTAVTLPEGYAYFRRLGWFSTDTNGNINKIANDDQVDLSSRVGFVGEYIGTAKGWNGVVQANCYLYLECGSPKANIQVAVNGLPVYHCYITKDWANTDSCLIPIKNGQNLVITANTANYTANLYTMV